MPAAPLLEHREHRDRDVGREIGGGGVMSTDTLRSQTSRTHSESSPIMEVPEDSKDEWALSKHAATSKPGSIVVCGQKWRSLFVALCR